MSAPSRPAALQWLPLASALALSLTCPPWQQRWLIWIAMAPLLIWVRSRPRAGDVGLLAGAWFAGAAYHLSVLLPLLSVGWWGWGATTAAGVRAWLDHAHLFLGAVVILVACWAGVVIAGVLALCRRVLDRPLVAILVVPAAWVFLVEFLGHQTVFGFSWGLLGNLLYDAVRLRQLAALMGVLGMSFLVLMVNTLAAGWGWRLFNHGEKDDEVDGRSLWVATAVTVVVVLAAAGYGSARLAAPLPQAGAWNVALLQGARAEYAGNDFTADGMDRLYAPMIRQAADADLIVLPETVWLRTLALESAPAASHASPPITSEQMRSGLAGLLEAHTPVVILGLDARESGRFYNTTSFWTVDRLLGVYRKRRLVPFSEYRPGLLGRLAPRNRLHEPGFAFTPGHGAQLVTVRGVPVGAFICQEVLYPGVVRESVRSGAQLLVSTGNDGVFTSTAVAGEQAHLAMLRAVESGRYLVRATKTGISALIDPRGRVLAEAPVGVQQVLRGRVAPLTAQTPYTRHGDWFAWLCGGFLFAAGALYKPRNPRV